MKEMDFVERRKEAAAARKRLIEKMQQAPKFDDPDLVASRAAKAEAKAASALQRSEREALKHEALARQKAEAEARAVEAEIAAKAEAAATIEQSAAEKAAQKAERDRRYAARKSRQR